MRFFCENNEETLDLSSNHHHHLIRQTFARISVQHWSWSKIWPLSFTSFLLLPLHGWTPASFLCHCQRRPSVFDKVLDTHRLTGGPSPSPSSKKTRKQSSSFNLSSLISFLFPFLTSMSAHYLSSEISASPARLDIPDDVCDSQERHGRRRRLKWTHHHLLYLSLSLTSSPELLLHCRLIPMKSCRSSTPLPAVSRPTRGRRSSSSSSIEGEKKGELFKLFGLGMFHFGWVTS